MIYIEHLLNIAQKIEALVETHKIDYIDACILYCDQHNIEYEQLGDLIRKHQNIKSKIQIEAEQINFLKKTARLPTEG